MNPLIVSLTFVLLAVWLLARGPAAVADAVRRGWRHLLDARLGRGRLGLRADIPAELEEPGGRDARVDPQREALASYQPRATVLVPTPEVACREETAVLVRQPEPPADSFGVEEIDVILAMAAWPSYEDLWSVERRTTEYPVPVPAAPPEPPMPPAWTPAPVSLPVPRFELPLYRGWRRVFNRFVHDAYSGETRRVDRALTRKAELEAAAAARNAELAQLADLAQARWQAARDEQAARFVEHLERYHRQRNRFLAAGENDRVRSRRYRSKAATEGPAGLLSRVELVMRTMVLPRGVPREWKCRYDADSRVVIVEHRFPDLAHVRWHRTLSRRAGPVECRVSDKERREAAAKVHPALVLRLACEVARLDREGLAYGIAVNGWVVYRDPGTGRARTGYCATLFARKDDLLQLELAAADPLVAFSRLKGIAVESAESGLVAPIVRLDTAEGWPEPKGLVAGRPAGRTFPWDFPTDRRQPPRELVN
jgi:hypothetical protein